MASRKRSENGHDGTAGTPKTAQKRQSETAGRKDGSERRTGVDAWQRHQGAHDDAKTVTQSNAKRARPVALSAEDQANIGSLREIAQRDRGENAM
jgi:hypothetical protein